MELREEGLCILHLSIDFRITEYRHNSLVLDANSGYLGSEGLAGKGGRRELSWATGTWVVVIQVTTTVKTHQTQQINVCILLCLNYSSIFFKLKKC